MNEIGAGAARYYPPEMEKWWLDRVEESDVHTLENLHRNASVLSDHFTVKRDKGFPDYFKKPGHLLAYGVYFHPQSWVRVRFPLLEMIGARGWELPTAESKEAFRVLDVGAGPGSVGLSVVQLIQALRPGLRVELTAVDQSPHALEVLRRCHGELRSELWPNSSVRTQAKNMRYRSSLFYGGKERFDLVVLGFSLNEFCQGMEVEEVADFLAEAAERLLKKRGMLIILEPALQETSNAMSQLGEVLSGNEQLHYWGPYLHGWTCPLLAQGKFWNHEVRSLSPPDSLEYVNRRMQRRIHEVKFSFLSLSRMASERKFPESPEVFRLVSPVSRMKGLFLMSGAAGDGQVYTYELQFRGLSPEQKRVMRKMERGDILKVKNLEKVGEHWRIPKFTDVVEHFQVQ